MRFGKGGGRRKKVRWRWKGREIKEVKRYKYLGYVFQRNGKQEEQVKNRIKRGMVIMGQVWGIRKRKFGREKGKKVWLFNALVWTVMAYGVDLGLEGKRENGKDAGRILEMSDGGGVKGSGYI